MTSTCDCRNSPWTWPLVAALAARRNASGMARVASLVSALTRKYSSSMPKVYLSFVLTLVALRGADLCANRFLGARAGVLGLRVFSDTKVPPTHADRRVLQPR